MGDYFLFYKEEIIMATVNFDNLVIDRVTAGWFETKTDNKLLAVLDQISNFQVNTSSETKDKTDSQGALLKRFYTAKSVEVTGENAVFSMNLLSIQTGSEKKVGTDVVLPRIIQAAKPSSGTFTVELPDAPEDGTLIVVGTTSNGLPDVSKQYEKDDNPGAGKYSVTVSEGVTTIAMPTDATDIVQIKYEFKVPEGKVAARVDQTGDKFPKECKATFQVLCSDICDTETVVALYVVFPKFQISPDVELTFDTESSVPFSASALKDYCSKGGILYYIALVDDSDDLDVKPYK